MAKIIKRFGFVLLGVIILLGSFLRIWHLDKNPVSLFGDELDVGYQAYSILKTGKDYSGNAWPLHFQSLAEWRTPLYLYSAVPTVAAFGISPLGVRLPAAAFGILGIFALYLLVKELTNDEALALVVAGVVAFSPWHIQYSRAAFEATQLLAFLLFGLYFFFKSLKQGKYLWISGVLLALTPLIYSTAKLFVPLLTIFLFFVWRREILKISKRQLIYAVLAIVLVGVPTVYATFFEGGTQRFSYISVFSDPTIEPEVGTARLRDARMRGEAGEGLSPTLFDRFFHNKVTFWAETISANFLESYSTDFLFINGDPNPRHSIDDMGQFYKIEALALILGLCLFFVRYKDRKIKAFVAFWLIAGVLPAAITRDGGNHATRLILTLPPLVFLISYGIVAGVNLLRASLRSVTTLAYFGVWILSFGFYLHTYWAHNPWDSERWWHAGFKEAIQTIKLIDKDYDRVIISMSGEPAWIFFAGWYEYPPDKWHLGYPFKKTIVSGFGEISYIDKYYFGAFSPEEGGIYDLAKYIDSKTLYLAVAKEIGANLIREPKRTPPGLKLVKAVAFPSGEPAYYIFSK